jgi:cellulose synthase/poly-beta-1,6-N-acetylglucosamine synthase-like glycosyltransferase
MAATARRRGYTVKVCPSAKVRIETPRRVSDLILQRRRILFGHAEVWRRIGAPPRTIESLLFLSPAAGFRLLVATFGGRPKFLAALPVAFVTEVAAALLSILDNLRSSKAHGVWRRFA